MKRLHLRAPLTAALFTAALFGTCAASEYDMTLVRADAAQAVTPLEDSEVSCHPFGPRFSQRVQRFQRCLDQRQRLKMASKASFRQAANQAD